MHPTNEINKTTFSQIKETENICFDLNNQLPYERGRKKNKQTKQQQQCAHKNDEPNLNVFGCTIFRNLVSVRNNFAWHEFSNAYKMHLNKRDKKKKSTFPFCSKIIDYLTAYCCLRLSICMIFFFSFFLRSLFFRWKTHTHTHHFMEAFFSISLVVIHLAI